MTNKYTSSLADALHLLSAAHALASNKYTVPSALLLAETTPIGPGNKNLKVSETDSIIIAKARTMLMAYSRTSLKGHSEIRTPLY